MWMSSNETLRYVCRPRKPGGTLNDDSSSPSNVIPPAAPSILACQSECEKRQWSGCRPCSYLKNHSDALYLVSAQYLLIYWLLVVPLPERKSSMLTSHLPRKYSFRKCSPPLGECLTYVSLVVCFTDHGWQDDQCSDRSSHWQCQDGSGWLRPQVSCSFTLLWGVFIRCFSFALFCFGGSSCFCFVKAKLISPLATCNIFIKYN